MYLNIKNYANAANKHNCLPLLICLRLTATFQVLNTKHVWCKVCIPAERTSFRSSLHLCVAICSVIGYRWRVEICEPIAAVVPPPEAEVNSTHEGD